MIVNSSRGGGSKDTWVLEDGAPPDERDTSRDPRAAAARRCPTCATAAGPARPSSSSSSSARAADARADRPRALLARPQPRARRVHRARRRRRLPGSSSRASPRPRRACTLGWSRARRRCSARRRPAAARRRARERAAAPDARRRRARLDALERRARARGRARRARRHQRRDVGGDQHDGALPARRRHAGVARARPARTSPAATSRSASRSSAGSATARCCATRRKAFFAAGGEIEAADMVLRMLRVALPRRRRRRHDGGGPALALLQAVGGFQAFRRAVPAPPNAGPVARFLLFERAYPDSVAACVDALHESLLPADASPRDSEPVLRLSRLAADLEFQRRALPEDAEIGATLRGGAGRSSRASTRTSPSATSPVRARPPRPSCRHAPPRRTSSP